MQKNCSKKNFFLKNLKHEKLLYRLLFFLQIVVFGGKGIKRNTKIVYKIIKIDNIIRTNDKCFYSFKIYS